MKNYNKDTEGWKDIQDYEGIYQVSDLGRVKSIERVVCYTNGNSHKNGGSHTVPERIKKQTIKIDKRKTSGYNIVALYKENKGTQHYIHRLVANAFIENPLKKETVNHIDGDKQNNNVNNLEWATYLENNEHAIKTGLSDIEKRTLNVKRKQVKKYDLNWNFIQSYPSMREAQRQTGCDATQVGKCCKNKSKTSGGFHWSYN